MLFQDSTVIDTSTLPKGRELWINGRCTDIRKETVSKIYEQASGNRLLIDPETHHGSALRKSDVNGAHDGFIVECPCPREDGFVYQKLIDNSVHGSTYVEDIRVAVVGNELPVALIKRYPMRHRFSAFPLKVEIHDPRSLFTEEERNMIGHFSKELGLDFGEIDVLRHCATGKLYIVDANPTCLAHPVRMPYRERIYVIRAVAASFVRQFFPRAERTYVQPSLTRVSSVQ